MGKKYGKFKLLLQKCKKGQKILTKIEKSQKSLQILKILISLESLDNLNKYLDAD
jgi:hypothetical protein